MTPENNKRNLGFGSEFSWEEAIPLTTQELRELFIRSDSHISEALRRTNKSGHKFMGKQMGQEFGFIAFGDLSEQNRRIHLSPLLAGQEGSIHLVDLSKPYFEDNPTLPHTGIFDFHSHTYTYLEILRELQHPSVAEIVDKEWHYFSPTDLESYFYLTRVSPFYIRALGTERDGVGQVVLMSFKDLMACAFFDPERVYEKSKQHIRAGNDPLDVYIEAGLNTALIRVDLTQQTVLNQNDLDTASVILTQRNF